MNNVNESVKYTNALGASITLDSASIEGLGDVGADIQLQRAPYQDGSTYIDTVLEPRYISVEFIVRGESYEEVVRNRNELATILNPKLGLGMLSYTVGDGTEITERFIEAVAESVPFFPDRDNRGKRWQRGTVTFVAPNPYWITEEQVDQLVVWEGGLTFPLSLPTTFSTMSEDKSKILLNNGDVETPLYIVFEGPATSPITVENITTGEHITIRQDLLQGERLEINTAFGEKRVTKVLANGERQNAFHYITLGSSFFNLIEGNNLIDYSTGQDFERSGVTITWRNRYVSV